MIDAFRRRFGGADNVRVFRAPGRVNLIGEHTDYNMGFVMPVALHMATWIATAPSADGKLRIASEGQPDAREWDVAELAALTPSRHWTDYPIGVAQQVLRAGYRIEPANLLIRSTAPEGAGLSSSAALEVSSALAFLRGQPIEPLELARLCQRAEREFVGMPCGIMDQYISVFGRANTAIRIDCRSLENDAVSLPDGVRFLAVNTMVKHALAGSAYKDRTLECADAARRLGAASLRDVTPEQLTARIGELPPVVAKRARHVVSEDQRVIDFEAASAAGEVERMGRLMVESHRSLQHDYEVSCEELDFLVDAALGLEGVIGARMTGGGFGGCTVTMLRPEAEERFRADIAAAYAGKFGVQPRIYPCIPSAGAGEVENFETIPPAN
jgi:galactokinase